MIQMVISSFFTRILQYALCKSEAEKLSIFSSVSFPRKLQLDNQNLQKIDSLFTELQEESLEENLMQKENILALITRIYIQSVRLFSKDQQLLNPANVFSYIRHYQEFEALLEEHFLVRKSSSYYADLLGITAKHLNRITQTVVQKGFRCYYRKGNTGSQKNVDLSERKPYRYCFQTGI